MIKAIFFIALSLGVVTGDISRLPGRYPDLDPKRMVRGGLSEENQNSYSYPDSLQLIGSYTTQGKARDVWVAYPYAYLASDWVGVEILNISDPTNPTLVNTIDTPGQCFDIQIQDTLIYVADDYSGFQILNSAGIVGGYDTPRIARGKFVQGNYAYIADHESLLIFDISDPTNPLQVGSLILNSSNYSATRGIFVEGNYAYIADEFGGSPINGAMWIVDISNPASPVTAGVYNDTVYYFFPYNIYVKDSLAYVANYFNELFIIDVSDPANPFRVSFAYPPTGFAWDVKVSGSHAYVANYDGGLWVVDISDPASPQTASIYDTPGFASGVFVDSPYVYVADYYSLLIFEHYPVGVEEDPDFRLKISDLRLMQNQPNPFHFTTLIRYQIPLTRLPDRQAGFAKGGQEGDLQDIRLAIYDITGRLLKTLVDEEVETGVYQTMWDGKDKRGEDVSSGIYFYRLQAGSRIKTRKMTLLK